MKKTFFTAGPSQLYPTLPQHIAQALADDVCSISHRSKEYRHIVRQTTDALRQVWDIPAEYHIFFFSSATEIWERLLQNCADSTSFHFVNGAFSEKFHAAARALHRHAPHQTVKWGNGFDIAAAAVPENAQLINFTHNESSTGVAMPLQEIYAFRKTHPDALISVDMVSSAPYPIVDWQQVDAVYFSVQKGFGLPAGLGVGIFSERCVERAATLKASGAAIGSYHDFLGMKTMALQDQTPETPNMLAIYLLGKVCQDMLQRNMASLRAEMQAKAERIYSVLENNSAYTLFVEAPALRSPTVIVAEVQGGNHALLSRLSAEGIEVGEGYGQYKSTHIRIANFPTTTPQDVERLLALL